MKRAAMLNHFPLITQPLSDFFLFFLKLEGKHLRQRIILFRISELSLFKHFIILGLACSHSEALRSAEEGFRLSPKRP